MIKGFLAAIAVLFAGCSMDGAQQKPADAEQQPQFNLPIPDYTQMTLQEQMRRFGFALGAKVYIRIIKEEKTLELWMLKADGKYHLYQKFPICVYSGDLGPKTRQGDKQSPEGFYDVTAKQMNPNSRFHLAFNLGFPNAYDRAHGYTGDYLMVHGNCVSIGCYAMGDSQIEHIYAIVSAAQQRGQYAVPVHVYPFRMTQENLLRRQDNKWFNFWTQLKPAWDYFEFMHVPPQVSAEDGRYVIGDRVGVSSGAIFNPAAESVLLQNAPAAKPAPASPAAQPLLQAGDKIPPAVIVHADGSVEMPAGQSAKPLFTPKGAAEIPPAAAPEPAVNTTPPAKITAPVNITPPAAAPVSITPAVSAVPAAAPVITAPPAAPVNIAPAAPALPAVSPAGSAPSPAAQGPIATPVSATGAAIAQPETLRLLSEP